METMRNANCTKATKNYSVYSRHCPARQFLDRLADKWTLLIIDRLKSGETRFNQLRRDIDGITQKVLSQTLKKLERDGLIERRVFATMPVTVGYSLTPLALTLVKTIESLAHWAEDNMDAMREAQTRYDTQYGLVKETEL
ncbi:winged helix-turn-helix transcriptional regulator [Tolumonas lignilytica]|jgi:Predicted transcriptional regulators|uniref:winged helix-turn-helix transcriptional regulator n=1 Tax=Tolumonas lignilytica TaxID=1283284 RepID=UPI000464FD92|nr:helix-turn-helix domain-containing protein [Tolumonas lignilytica]